jgi:hypothetical protein
MSENVELQEVKEETVKQPKSSEVKVWESLEPKLQLFAVVYAENQNLTACAEEFGVKRSTCSSWSRRPAVAALVNHHLKKFQDQSLVNRQLMERVLLDVCDVGMGLENTHGVNKDGIGYQEKVTNLPAVNQAVGMLHKIGHDKRSLEIKDKETNAGSTVIINIEHANFNSNKHADLLAQKNEKVINHE